ncbi:Protein CBG12982 [Caenorhabditis briggsae]|uniref:Uncharacterized protein n=2 Tax=Caenorhabditis briggsae TaxID=6238 RepID=A0AAE9DIK6_CAEBR|nr:Protein CBG12982 [Caenorhabditis briggsae]ULU05405.1 hypothetical protein L3Y34_017822 [Caenorhabditis briggsae]UMM17371.1 hypothetical protein L5515_013955 [Caenorhabditis briggsae]CAP31862.1 Protein CBG12982 [Caenorhabditis briggsae]
MTDQMRDMIAQLMGSQHVDNKEKPAMPFDHHSVCRAFLLGVCPHDMVPDSRLQNVVSCRKVHEPAHKADYERAQKERDHFYDVDAFDIIENAVRLVDVEIAKVREKLEDDVKTQTSQAADSKAKQVAEIEEKIAKNVDEIEKLGNEGKIEESMKLHKYVEELKEKIQEIEESQTEIKTAGPGSNSAKLRVCEDCGAQLNITDHESRIADHYNGKMHIGMVETRETYLKMKETIDDRRKERDEKMGSQRGYQRRDTYARRDRDRGDYRGDRDRDRDRDRRNRDRSRSRERSYRRDDRDRRYDRDSRDRRDRDRRY